MSLRFFYDGVEIVDQVRFADGTPGFVQSAVTGTASACSVIIDDPGGTADYEAWHEFTVDEDDCAFQRVFTGYVFSKRITRGPFRTGPGRQWVLDLVDENGAFGIRIISGADGKRPAETDLARVGWITTAAYLTQEAVDNGGCDLTNDPVPFGEADYRGQYPLDVFVSIAGTAGKNSFAYYDEPSAEIAVFYDGHGTPLATSTLAVSNVLTDQDATTYFPLIDAEQVRAGDDQYGGIYFGWRGGAVYATSPATIASMGRLREIAYSTDRVGKLATAQTLANSMLASHIAEIDTITCSVLLPSTDVNLIRAGMNISVKFSHLPGFTSFTTAYVLRRFVAQEHTGQYRVQLELSTQFAPRAPGGGAPGNFPYQPGAYTFVDSDSSGIITGTHTQVQAVYGSAPAAGQLLIGGLFNRAGATPLVWPTGWVELPPYDGLLGRINAAYKVANGTESATITVTHTNVTDEMCLQIARYNGGSGTTLADQNESSTNAATSSVIPAITPVAGAAAVMVVLRLQQPSLDGSFPAGWTQREEEFETIGNRMRYEYHDQIVAAPTGSYDGTLTGIADGSTDYDWMTIAFAGGGGPPGSGQPVNDVPPAETPNGTNPTFTSPFPFADESLRVLYDGTDQTAHLTSYDGVTGSFTLDFNPRSGGVIRLWFLGR